MKRFLLEENSLDPLTDLDSFVIPKNDQVFSGQLLAEDEQVIGMYINEHDHLVMLTYTAIYWLRNEVLKQIDYDSIAWITVSDTEDSLEIELQNHIKLTLPILNHTDETPDVYCLRDFLMKVIFYPSYSENLEQINEINSRADLSNFLHNAEWTKFDRVAAALRSGFPKDWQLRRFNIDPSKIDSPDIWRLLAVFLTSDVSDEWNQDRDRRPSNFKAREYLSLGEERAYVPWDTELKMAEIPPHIKIRITPDTKEIVDAAEDQSKQLGLHYVGVEMLLLASITNFRMLSFEVLNLPDVDIEKITSLIVSEFGITVQPAKTRGDIALNQRCLDIMEMAFLIASKEIEDPDELFSVTARHILKALLTIQDGSIPRILQKIRNMRQ